jgi:hypothetical protein
MIYFRRRIYYAPLLLALFSLLLVSGCRQASDMADNGIAVTPTAVPDTPAPAPTDPPPAAPEPTPLPLPTPWPTAVYDPNLPEWAILVYTTADWREDWQTAPITGSVQLLVAAGGDLATFVADGRQTTSANRYALILNSDSAPPELVEAIPPFDLILFDQPQTARLELLSEWQPYGRIAVGSPAFAAGWATPARIARLTAELPAGEAAAWANWLLDDYIDGHPAPALLDWQPLTAVDLQQLPLINRYLTNLAAPPLPEAPPIAPPLTMRMATRDQYDLGQWAGALGEMALVTAVNEALLQTTGGAFAWRLAFQPPHIAAPPLVNSRAVHNLPLDSGQPAYLLLELAGLGLGDFEMQTGRYEDDERLRLMHREIVPPLDSRWVDGVHQFPWLWHPLTPYLSDGETAGHLPLWTLVDGRLAAIGQYNPASGPPQESWLILTPQEAGLVAALWLLPENAADWRIIAPEAGDQFAVYNAYLEEDGRWQMEAGGQLDLLPEGGLQLSAEPLPPGDYVHRFVGSNMAGETAVAQVSWQMAASPRWPNQAIYLDMETGFQLAYPANWPPLREVDGRWRGHNPQQTTQLTITRLTDWPGTTPNDLQQNALAVFGEVERLWEEPVLLDGRAGVFTAYGYSGIDGPRTGLLLAFIRDAVGYLVDIDGPLEAEADNLALARQVAASWAFWPPLVELSGQWRRLETADFAVYQPAAYRHQPLDNGWHLLREPDSPTFLALRQDAAGGRDSLEAARHWLGVAGRDVANFTAKEATGITLAGRRWTRIDFSYTQSAGQPIYGLIMTVAVDGREWAAWIEAPAASFETVTDRLLLYAIASMESR